MNLRRRFAARDLSRSLFMLLSSLLVAPLTHAENQGTLQFDVPNLGEAPVTINLLAMKFIQPNQKLVTTDFLVSPANEGVPFGLFAKPTGDYCVTLFNKRVEITLPTGEQVTKTGIGTAAAYGGGKGKPGGVGAPINPGDEFFLTFTTNPASPDSAARQVFDTNDRSNAVDANDPACAMNKSPIAVLMVPAMVNDTDFKNGEMVMLDASGSNDPDGGSEDPAKGIANFEFRDAQGNILASGPESKVTVPLPDGLNEITLIVTDRSQQPVLTLTRGANATARNASYGGKVQGKGTYGGYGNFGPGSPQGMTKATVNVLAPAQLIADAGPDSTVADSNNQPGEPMVTLNGSASQVPKDAIYRWFLVRGGDTEDDFLGEGQVITPPLPDGTNNIVLRITLPAYSEEGGEPEPLTDTVVITVQPPTATPAVVVTVSIKPAAIVADSDEKDGENVTLDGSASVIPEGVNATFQYFANPRGESDGDKLSDPDPTLAGRIITALLPNGPTTVRLVIIANGFRFSADATVNVTAPPAATVVAAPGTYAPKQDTDGFPGEVFTLTSQSTVPPNVPVTFQWFQDPAGAGNGTPIGTGPTINPRLRDGRTVVRLVVTANAVVSSADTTVQVGSPGAATTLANLPNLTPNQRRTAVALDDVCGRLIGLSSGLNGPARGGDAMLGNVGSFTDTQADLANKCRGIGINNTVDNQVEAVADITPEDFAVARTQALLFANTQYASVLDRLIALRGGARGLSLAGLNIIIDGKSLPVAAVKDTLGKIFGSGASADATEEPGGLLSDRWGMWVRGNYSAGSRDRSLVSPSFDVDQAGIVMGTDYRLSNNAVIGASVAYLDSSIDFNPGSEGGLDTKSMALSLYGSLYAAKSFYLDALANVAKADYEASRNISFTQGSNLGLLDLDAKGDTDGITLSAGLSGGYDFLFKGVTISPNAGFFYIDATIDQFAESGASGLNLLYDEQNFQSFTSNLGFRVNTTWNLPWVVLLPGLRVDYIREFNDDVDVFQVRFTADPNGASAPPITIQTDNPDSSYYRVSLNLSAQFKYGLAGYVEYQRIQSYSQIDFADLAFGFRMQRSF